MRRHRQHRASIIVLLISALLLMGEGLVASGQSGRRPPKRIESPNPLPPKQEEPPIKAPEDKSKSRVPVKVAWYLQNISNSPILSRIVQSGCLERLSQSNSVNATPAEDLNRKQASDIAKASTDVYVLWFEVELDGSQTSRVGLDPASLQDLYVRYEVFTPGTGKTKTTGRIYQRSRGPGGLPLPMPAPGSTMSAEYSLRYAGREMADRLLDALNLPHPAERR